MNSKKPTATMNDVRVTNASRPSLKGATVLVVDDDGDLRDIVGEALTAVGATVHLAADGVEALALLDTVNPDVIVSDVRMPRCDGLQLMQRVGARASAGKNAPGFIIMTGFFDVPSSEILSLGGHEVLIKPFEGLDVAKSVAAYLRTMRRAS